MSDPTTKTLKQELLQALGRTNNHLTRLISQALIRGGKVDDLQQALGDEKWVNGMNPELAPDELFDNPYQYSDYSQSDASG